MKHAPAKKRRRGGKVKLRVQKHRVVRIANAVVMKEVKELYNKNLTPAENLANFGLMSDSNDIKTLKEAPIDKKKAAFVGYAELPSVPKKKIISEWDREYINGCVQKHGENVAAMIKDISVNYNQLTEAKFMKLYAMFLEE